MYGFIFSVGIYRFVSFNLNQPELAKQIFYVYGVGVILIMAGFFFRDTPGVSRHTVFVWGNFVRIKL